MSCLSSLVKFRSVTSEKKLKMSQQIEASILVFLKNTNLVEDVEFLLPVKFRQIPFSGFRGEVENVKS